MTRLFGALCSGLACVVLVAGCSESFSLTDSSTPTPTPPTPEPTSSPTVTRETPEEFVRRWVEVDREMQNTGDTAEYRELTQGCIPCDGVADQIEAIYADGGYVKTKGLVIRSVRASEKDANREVVVRLSVRSTPTEYVESAGAGVKTFPGGLVTYLITLQPQRLSWRITLLERLAQ